MMHHALRMYETHKEGRDTMSKIQTQPSHTITIDRFTFEPKALPEADGRFHAQLMVDSGNGAGRTQRFFTFKPLFKSADRALAYAAQQAGEWMKQKSLA